ncbi:MAG: hypothetical protein RQ741_13750, partial [Wenzhouxiangellaceae bacterium]|nr:hypothetical protein [Wenzhouxiangellaceae bacterium]
MDNHQAITQSTRKIVRTTAFVLATCALLLTGFRHPDGDYRVVEREYVPADEIPGIAEIDLERASFPVLVGSVAIAEQFPDLVWPDMVNEERWRLGLPPELQAELLYPRECLFVAPARNGIGTIRRIIDGEVIFFRIHRAAGVEPGHCQPDADGVPSNRCYTITALSESSGMCKDSIDVNRLASFDAVLGENDTRIFYADQDSIFVRSLSIKNGCPHFSNRSKRVTRIGNFTQHIRAHESQNRSVHIAWVDKTERARSQGLKYVRYQDREITSQVLVSRYVPSGRSLGY